MTDLICAACGLGATRLEGDELCHSCYGLWVRAGRPDELPTLPPSRHKEGKTKSPRSRSKPNAPSSALKADLFKPYKWRAKDEE